MTYYFKQHNSSQSVYKACVVILAYLSRGLNIKSYERCQQKPAFILELKVNLSPEEALQQIKEKKYALALKDYTGEKLAVGISWDKETKAHEIMIEKI